MLIVKKTGLVILLIAVMLNAAFALRQAAGELFVAPIQDMLHSIKVRDLIAGDYETLLDAINHGLNLEARDANYWQAKGDLLLFQIGDQKPINVEKAQSAVEAYRQALAAKPARAYLWAGLVVAKGLAGEFDNEFLEAYRHGVETQYWDYQANDMLLRSGLAWWQHLDSDTTILFREVLRRHYAVAPSKTILYAKQYGQQRLACTIVRDMPQTDGMCRSLWKQESDQDVSQPQL